MHRDVKPHNVRPLPRPHPPAAPSAGPPIAALAGRDREAHGLIHACRRQGCAPAAQPCHPKVDVLTLRACSAGAAPSRECDCRHAKPARQGSAACSGLAPRGALRAARACEARGWRPQVMIDHEQRKLRLIDWGLAEFYHPSKECGPAAAPPTPTHAAPCGRSLRRCCASPCGILLMAWTASLGALAACQAGPYAWHQAGAAGRGRGAGAGP